MGTATKYQSYFALRSISKSFSFSSIVRSMDYLPPNKGLFKVGCADFMTPKYFNTNDDVKDDMNIPGYFMKFFYPTRKDVENNYERAKWIPKGIYADGFIRFLHLPVFVFGSISRWLMGGTRLHAYEDAPILKTDEKYPIVIFSHGMGANKTCYASFCSDLASKGFFVAAVEHRDKSASATYYIDETKTEVEVPFRKLIKGEDEYKLRNMQVKQRALETSAALTIISMLNGSNSSTENMLDSKFDFKTLQGTLNLDKVAVAGHSFGGCTALKTLAQDKRFKCGVVLDAWMFPLEDTVYGNADQPVLFLNSESFHWKGNVKKITKFIGNDSNKRMLTIRGTGHHSQCDIPAIIPTWILRVFRMSAKMDHDQAIELHRKLMTSHFKKCLDLNLNENDKEELACDNEVIIEGTNLEIPEEEQESWYHQS